MAIFGDITPAAVAAIEEWAARDGIDPAFLYVRVDVKPTGPYNFFWILSLTRAYDPTKYDLEERGGIRFAVDKDAAIFLVGSGIDYRVESEKTYEYPTRVVTSTSLPNRTRISITQSYSGTGGVVGGVMERPVWPRGFVFSNQMIYPDTRAVAATAPVPGAEATWPTTSPESLSASGPILT